MTSVKTALAKFGYIIAGWTLLALIQASCFAFRRAAIGSPVLFFHTLHLALFDYWIWAALTPIIFLLARQFPFTRQSWPTATAIHFVCFLLLTLAHECVAQLLDLPVYAPATFHGSVLWLRFSSSLHEGLWMYWPVVVVWGLLDYYQRYREQDLRAAQLKTQLSRAELQALRNQLHPHFLFNTLNSVASLMHDDVHAADDMLGDLSHLLRAYLSGNDEQEVRLRYELQLLDTYVRIQKRRFEDRLSLSLDVPADLLDVAVPSLLLQPLVENSILHGIAPRSSPGYVRVTVRRDGSALCLEITDNGMGLRKNFSEGIGLSNTRSRLRQLYQDRQSFEVTNGENGGVAVRISVPLQFLHTVASDDDTNLDRGRRTPGPPAGSVVAQSR
jgi:two-component system LytT family sensor kinase